MLTLFLSLRYATIELMEESLSCFYCHHSLYRLADGMVKCSVCKRKYSLRRIEQIKILIKLFCSDENALSASKNANVTYATALKYYQQFRRLIAGYCETQYNLYRLGNIEYEEYLYTEKSKRKDKTAIFDSYNVLTFGYGEKVYTLLMPSLRIFKHQFIEDHLETTYHKEFSKFMRMSKIIKISEYDNSITKFWHYFEQFITPYKGVSHENFSYYLKEAEFKFNTPLQHRMEIIERLYFSLGGSDI